MFSVRFDNSLPNLEPTEAIDSLLMAVHDAEDFAGVLDATEAQQWLAAFDRLAVAKLEILANHPSFAD
jgi:hypothetical protein